MYCCSALGREPSKALEINAAWALIYAAFYLLDKVEDQEIITAPFSFKSSQLINITTGFILSASSIVSKLDIYHQIEPGAHHKLENTSYRMLLSVCAGQHNDLTSKKPDLEQVWKNNTAKSGAFFSLGCLCGAQMVTDQPEILHGFKSYGYVLGVLLQIANDIDGLWKKGKGQSDLSLGQVTLPVAYAYRVLSSADSERLSILIQEARSDYDAEKEARSIIIKCGALVYLLLEAERLRLKAKTILNNLNLPAREKESLFEILNQFCKFEEVRRAAARDG